MTVCGTQMRPRVSTGDRNAVLRRTRWSRLRVRAMRPNGSLNTVVHNSAVFSCGHLGDASYIKRSIRPLWDIIRHPICQQQTRHKLESGMEAAYPLINFCDTRPGKTLPIYFRITTTSHLHSTLCIWDVVAIRKYMGTVLPGRVSQ